MFLSTPQDFDTEHTPGHSNKVILNFMKTEDLAGLNEFLASGKARIEDRDEVIKILRSKL